jgi:hypothetical protein
MAWKVGAWKTALDWIFVGMDLRDESMYGWTKDSSLVYIFFLLVPFASHSSNLLLAWAVMDLYWHSIITKLVGFGLFQVSYMCIRVQSVVV